MIPIVMNNNGNYFARLMLELLLVSNSKYIHGVGFVNRDHAGHTNLKTVLSAGVRTTVAYKVLHPFIFMVFAIIVPKVLLNVRVIAARFDLPKTLCNQVNSKGIIEFAQHLNRMFL